MCGRAFILIVFVSFLIISCRDKERSNWDGNKNIFASYNFWGEEGKEFITAFFQFHAGEEEDPGFVLDEPAKVYLDDVLLMPDSARQSGVFYEMQIPIKRFAGKHTIRFIDRNNKEYSEEFSFTPFGLLNKLPDTVKRDNLILHFKGLNEKDVLRVVMTDTAFKSEGINEIDTVYNNLLDLRKFLNAITNGPVTLHLYKEEEQLLHEKGYGKGIISITYALKREFELKD